MTESVILPVTWVIRLTKSSRKKEIMKRFPVIEVVGEPKRILSSLLRGYGELPIRIPAQGGHPASREVPR
jgi:hypothetical protein